MPQLTDSQRSEARRLGWRRFGSRKTIAVTNVAATVLSLVLLALTWSLEPNPTLASVSGNALLVVLGTLSGWVLAVFWVPFDATEKSVYTSIGAAVTAFISGYVVSKFDRLFEAALYPGGTPDMSAIAKMGFFLAALAIAAIVVVTNRVDWLTNEKPRRPNAAAGPADEPPHTDPAAPIRSRT
jgi:hypothetical protein